MLTTAQLLDKAKAAHSVSDYKLSFLLEVTPSAITNYRAGRSHPNDEIAERLALLAGQDPQEVVIWMQIERAKSDETRAIWRGIAERLQRAGVAAAVILSLGFWTGGPDGGALASTAQPSQAGSATPSVYYVNRLILQIVTFARRWLQKRNFAAIPASPVWAM